MTERTLIDKIPIQDYWYRFVRQEDLNSVKAVICPWHDDHHPSLVFNKEKRFMRCYSCGSGGNIVDIHAKVKGLSKKEAIEDLAHLYNIEDDYSSLTLEQIKLINRQHAEDTELLTSRSKVSMLLNMLNDVDLFCMYDVLRSYDLPPKIETLILNDFYLEVIKGYDRNPENTKRHLHSRFIDVPSNTGEAEL